jgi:hypothetical protein
MWTCFRHSFLVADESNQSTSYAANFGSWFLGFVFARWSLVFRLSLFLMFEVVDNTDGGFDIADNKDGDDARKKGSWFLGFVFARWSSAFRTSLFLMFKVVDDTDGDFDIADSEDGDDAKKKSVDNREDTVEGVENNGDDSTTNEEPTTADTALFFLEISTLTYRPLSF